MSHTKPAPESDRDHQASDTRSENSRDSPMKARLLDALEEGTDIGHSGRLVFAMVARDFLDDEETIRLLASQPNTMRRRPAEQAGHSPSRSK